MSAAHQRLLILLRLNASRDGSILNFRGLLDPQFGVVSSKALMSVAPFAQDIAVEIIVLNTMLAASFTVAALPTI